MLLQAQFIFLEGNNLKSEIKVSQLMNHDSVRRMIPDNQIFSSLKHISGTPQYFHNILLDVLAKTRQFGVYTFFLNCSAAEFQWAEIIQVVACQY